MTSEREGGREREARLTTGAPGEESYGGSVQGRGAAALGSLWRATRLDGGGRRRRVGDMVLVADMPGAQAVTRNGGNDSRGRQGKLRRRRLPQVQLRSCDARMVIVIFFCWGEMDLDAGVDTELSGGLHGRGGGDESDGGHSDGAGQEEAVARTVSSIEVVCGGGATDGGGGRSDRSPDLTGGEVELVLMVCDGDDGN